MSALDYAIEKLISEKNEAKVECEQLRQERDAWKEEAQAHAKLLMAMSVWYSRGSRKGYTATKQFNLEQND